MVRAAHPALYLTHARAFATHRCGVEGCEGVDGVEQRAMRGAAHEAEGDGDGFMGCEGVDGQDAARPGWAREARGSGTALRGA